MQSSNQKSILSINQKKILAFLFILIMTAIFLFRNVFFQPTILLKSFGELSLDPEIALTNKKPTFLEFYAEWCEVCKEMAPKISALKDEYEKDINFVFLNVDNPRWENYVRNFSVNGIPQVNLFNDKGILEQTFVGKQEETKIKKSLENLNRGISSSEATFNSESSLIQENKKNYQISPRSHG